MVVDGVGATRLVVPRSSEMDQSCAETNFARNISTNIEINIENMRRWPDDLEEENLEEQDEVETGNLGNEIRVHKRRLEVEKDHSKD